MTPPIIGEAPRALSRGARLIDGGAQAGPASYLAGGFTIATDLAVIDTVQLQPRNSQILAATDTMYETRYTVAGGVITVLIFFATFTGASTQDWTQIADATDLSGVTFDYLAFGTSA